MRVIHNCEFILDYCVKQVNPQEQFLLFGLTFDSACKTNGMRFRRDMGQIVKKLYDQYLNGFSYEWEKVKGIRLTPDNYTIFVGKINHLSINLMRFELLEKLRIIQLYFFKPNRDPDATIIVDGKEINQTQWVYNQVMRIIPRDRVLISKFTTHRLTHLPK